MPLPRYNKKTIKGVYTREQRVFLLKNAGKMTVEDMAESLGKTVESVKSQCQKQMINYGIKPSRASA